MTEFFVFDRDSRLMFTPDGRFRMENDDDGPIETRAPSKLCCPCPEPRTCADLNAAIAAGTPVICQMGQAMINMPDPTASGCGPPYGMGWTVLWNPQTIVLTYDGFFYTGFGQTAFLNPIGGYANFVTFRLRFKCGVRPNEHTWPNCSSEIVPARANGFDAEFDISSPHLGCVRKDGLTWNTNWFTTGVWEFDDGATFGTRCCNNLALGLGGYSMFDIPISFTW